MSTGVSELHSLTASQIHKSFEMYGCIASTQNDQARSKKISWEQKQTKKDFIGSTLFN